ncbi:zinc-dependent alcohol dehydrogenase family protein [Subsaximicrobium wynnwilliamsii]|uniref:Zinc-dependent alcohol dehydrogenase family protein n=1 Tax=Subsaximicrobium wynnwilliamsii TaxID=291179 RepID=A0A5C6ZEF1_9FLAO|nr:zinc-dependent alcohol dehydrogenase family protein [Subsaximicrobium wynnwilliamsii]TXD82674.1 zinc-dependent alcohol dehydrogenase family protein [Subsaximicrobium wynnwilliamsii]TXD88409.1 zinc-dependent alcohol dehydrogenase family protein [Subsaximicrobium wynnwilliamsii]TXE02336.1 zinc-dependent alcohol dehydrogenase family protein [Subsaximicrobium wynnwilliamsii]
MKINCSVIRFHKTGELDVLALENVTMEDPENDEVLFKVDAFALNRADVLHYQGFHTTVPDFPSRIGSEATGEVVKVGNKVTDFKVGDRVTSIPFNTAKYGVQGEYAVVPQDYLTKAPKNLTVEEACSIWMQYSTAYFALFHIGSVKKGDYVFIPAISSSAGYGCFELARDAGAIAICSTRTSVKKEELKQLGIDHLIVTKEEPVEKRLMEITNGKGVSFVYDPVAGAFCDEYLEALSTGAVVIIYGLLDPNPTLFPLVPLIRKKATMDAYSQFNHVEDIVKLNECKAYILDRVGKGAIKPVVSKVFDFKDYKKAYEYMLSNQQVGKIVVRVNTK